MMKSVLVARSCGNQCRSNNNVVCPASHLVVIEYRELTFPKNSSVLDHNIELVYMEFGINQNQRAIRKSKPIDSIYCIIGFKN